MNGKLPPVCCLPARWATLKGENLYIMESQLELAEFVKNIKDNRPHFSGVTYSDEKLNKALLKLNKNFHTKDQIKLLLGRKFHKSIKNLYKISQILKYEFITPTTIMPIATTGALTDRKSVV